jgi:histidinol-phosphate aminotransferase
MIAPRTAVATMSSYRAGRSARDIAPAGTQDMLARLASNESPFPPLPSVVEAITRHAIDVNRYPEPTSASLRNRIAVEHDLEPGWVATGAGSVGLLWQIAQTFLDAGREIVTPWPSFEAYPIIAQLMGATHVAAPLSGRRPSLDGLLAHMTERTDLVVVAQPNNPTGTSFEYAEIAAVAAETAGRCVFVIDEAYLEFGDDPSGERSRRLVLEHPHVIVLRTFSKAHGLAGLRVGYALAAPTIIELLDRVAPPFAVSSLASVAAITSLSERSEMAARVRLVNDERERVVDRLVRIGVTAPPTATNFVWLPTVRGEFDVASALEGDGVLARPIRDHGIRVTIGTAAENDKFLASIEAHRALLDQPAGRMAVA